MTYGLHIGHGSHAGCIVGMKLNRDPNGALQRIRIFDCLNDLRNLETAVKASNKEKGHAQIALSYTLGDSDSLPDQASLRWEASAPCSYV